MKLYATVASERAKKGQGGNEFLEIIFNCKEREVERTLGVLKLKAVKNGVQMEMDTEQSYNHGFFPVVWENKGERQKGEKVCSHCGARVKTSLEEWHCSNCGVDN